jgi:hypothetical protein
MEISAKAVMLDNYMRVIAFGCLTPLSSIYQLIVVVIVTGGH